MFELSAKARKVIERNGICGDTALVFALAHGTLDLNIKGCGSKTKAEILAEASRVLAIESINMKAHIATSAMQHHKEAERLKWVAKEGMRIIGQSVPCDGGNDG